MIELVTFMTKRTAFRRSDINFNKKTENIIVVANFVPWSQILKFHVYT